MKSSERHVVKTLLYTFCALIAFAANSVLCRLALGENTIDAPGFTVIRLLTGAIVLVVLLRLGSKTAPISSKGSWMAGFMLFLYAITFSLAYTTLDTGTGALILFGAVQLTIILLSFLAGNRLYGIEWMGLLLAFSGLVYLVLPGVSTPSFGGFLLMAAAGIAWGIYTMKGKGSKKPLQDTTYNFLRTMPFVVIVAILGFRDAHFSVQGVGLAMLSGGIASGIGYAVWYKALPGLTSTQAAVVQLSVPVIAAMGGVVFVSEVITLRLGLASIMILGGILMVVLGRYYFVRRKIASAPEAN